MQDTIIQLVTLEEAREHMILALRTGTPASFRATQAKFIDLLAEEFADMDLNPGFGEFAGEAIRRIDELFLLWNPIGFLRSDVTRILGCPSQKDGDTLVYVYDSGFGMLTVKIRIEADTISGLDVMGGE